MARDENRRGGIKRSVSGSATSPGWRKAMTSLSFFRGVVSALAITDLPPQFPSSVTLNRS
jgi:hypothetical protein